MSFNFSMTLIFSEDMLLYLKKKVEPLDSTLQHYKYISLSGIPIGLDSVETI
jgi:hypothetical protein